MKYSSRSIAEAGHRGEVQLVEHALEAADADHRRTALGAAHRLGILDRDLLLTALADPSPSVRRRATELAARPPPTGDDRRAPDPKVVSALVGLLDDTVCAEIAAFALGELGATSPEVLSGLAAQAREHEDPLARESAVAALGSLGRERETVLAAVADVATVRRRAVIALANFEGPDVEEALQGAVDDRDWQVRQAAEDLLGPADD